jgi:hypothetical protein
MKTDDLIRALAADTEVERRPTQLAAMGLPVSLALAFAGLWLTLGVREDLLASLTVPESALRFVLTGALGLSGLGMAFRLARPEGRSHVRLWPLLAIAAAAAAAVLWAWIATPPGGRQMALVGKTMVTCLVTIPLMSILPVGVMLASLRRWAATSPALAGLAAGLGGGGLSAMVYALHCTEDSPLFYVTWYGLAIAGVTLAATLIGARVLRW